MHLFLDAMSDPDLELFSGSLDALPPEVRALLDELGVDIFLGVVSVDAGDGVVVVAVFPDSPAAHAGVAEGDLITEIDGAPVRGAAPLRADVEAVAEGASLTLTIDRSGAQRMIEVVREPASAGNVWRAELLRSFALLLALQEVPGGPDVPASLLGEMTEETVDGLRVFAVFPGSPADNGDIRPGDLADLGGGPLTHNARRPRGADAVLQPYQRQGGGRAAARRRRADAGDRRRSRRYVRRRRGDAVTAAVAG